MTADEIQSQLEKAEVTAMNLNNKLITIHAGVRAYLKEEKKTPYQVAEVLEAGATAHIMAAQALSAIKDYHLALVPFDNRPQTRSGGGGGK